MRVPDINTCYEVRNNKSDSWAPCATTQKHKNTKTILSARQTSLTRQRPRSLTIWLSKSSQWRLMRNKTNSHWMHNIIFHGRAQTHFGSNVLPSYLDEQFWIFYETDQSINLEDWWKASKLKNRCLTNNDNIIFWWSRNSNIRYCSKI